MIPKLRRFGSLRSGWCFRTREVARRMGVAPRVALALRRFAPTPHPGPVSRTATRFTQEFPSGGPRRLGAAKALARLLRFAPALRVTAPPRRGIVSPRISTLRSSARAGFARRNPWLPKARSARRGQGSPKATREAGLALTPSTDRARALRD